MDVAAKDATDSAETVDVVDVTADADAATTDVASAITAACGSSFFSVAAAVSATAVDAATTDVATTAACGSSFFSAAVVVSATDAAMAVDADARQHNISCIGLKRRSHFSYIFITLIPEGVTMAGKPSKPMTPFDKSVTPSYLYKLKLFLSFLPPSTQRFLAVYIKFSEFRYTMDYFRGLPFHAFSFQSIGELAPYMDENERNMMDQMTSMLQIMEMMVMAQTDSTSGGSDSCGPAGPVDLMKTMMSGEDMEMFQNYMDLFDQELSSPGTSAMKGDSSHEWNNESYSE